MSQFVAIHPETGDEYPVHSKSELVNLIARGYRDGSPDRTRTGGKSAPAAKNASTKNPAAPEAAQT